MTRTTPSVDRRTVLKATGLAAATSIAGCAAFGDNRPDGVQLAPPETYKALKDAELPYPIYGEPLPEATLPDILSGEPVSTTDLTADSHLLLTFVYTRCQGICLTLGHNLVQVQAAAAKEGYTDDITLGLINFDPEHDTSSDFKEWGESRGFKYSLGNVCLMRPETQERARAVVTEKFGEKFQANEEAKEGGMAFLHTGMVILANDQGFVERTWTGNQPSPNTVIDRVETLVGV